MNTPESYCLGHTQFKFKNQQSFYQGKVRDRYDLNDKIIMITSDRISAFDVILPRPIPYKGQVLNQIAAHCLNAVRDICPVWLESSPDPNVAIGKKCSPIPLEIVVRGYLSGHAWRTYKSGQRILCGVEMPSGLNESDPFPKPIITPTTKADAGHDQDISYEEILASQSIEKSVLDQLYDYAYKLFQRGSEMADAHGLILVDTKYEFGMIDNVIYLMDEIHTPDSSRYFIKEGYQSRQDSQQSQIQLSKEFVREWLMKHGFQGLEDQIMPEMPDAFVWEISNRYIQLYEKITGLEFVKHHDKDIESRIKKNLSAYLV
ncbi:MAG: phosphoribosylaminoimidazolesuccinocarboxamide synthase [Saprospiraceae bacterium]|nr:phosphoribosylaminoimidazolesuccinocarboxamide synthase [Candidatus Defluviibacterium haderslevense]